MEITKINNPSQDYLFLDLSESTVGNLLIVDNELTPVFYRKINGIIYDFKFQPNGELTFSVGPSKIYGMDSSGITINEFYAPPGITLDFHELRVLPDGSYYVLGKEFLNIDMSQYVQGGDTAAILVANTIHHMDANDNEIWRWNSFDNYNILDVADGINLTNHVIDWTHCNSIDLDSYGNVIISTRNFNEITKISRQTGEIIWRLGGEKNQFQFINDNRGFSRQHCARVFSNGNIALFDNGLYLIPEYSSFVEYEIDENNFTATLVRRYTRNESVFSQVLGSVQELANRDILICWGASQNPVVTEINEQDSIQFEFRFIDFGRLYRVYRFKWETNLFTLSSDSIDFGIVSIGDSSLAEINLYNPKEAEVIIN
ncbi:MAG TPA: aryl-sulfate sulfotransferase, partial [Ignavibacteriaceae bacterium]